MTKKTLKQEGLLKLVAAAKAGMAKRGLVSRFEMEAEEAKRLVGQSVMDKRLADLPPEDTTPKRCPLCGKETRVRKKAVPRTFTSLSGTHGELSMELEQRVVDVVLLLPPNEAAVHWNFLHPSHPVSDNQFRQVAKRVGAMADEADAHLLQSALLPPEEAPSETVYFMSDGGMLLLRAAHEAIEAQLGKGWREMKLGMAFRHESHVRGDTVTRGVLSQARYVGDFSQDKFKEQLKAAVDLECAAGAKRVVYVADGAPENWVVAEAIRPGALQILDWYHAVQNVMAFGKKLLGEEDAVCLKIWKQTSETLLAQGQVDELVRQLMGTLEDCNGEQLGALDDIIHYLRNNQSRMDYPRYRGMGLLIGSGPIESAQRHVIQNRMKRSGQRWSEKGARQMARMRAALKTCGPERLYRAVHWAYRETCANRKALNNLHAARKPQKRRASNA
ncbi:MAG: hypothetical protein ACKVPX_14650 [Myxococcaceae bacterium]